MIDDTKSSGYIRFLFFVCIVSALGGLLFGYDTVVIAGTVSMVKSQFALTAAMEGWFVSAALQGCLIGVAIAGWASDRFGRKNVLIMSSLFLLLSALGCGIAPEQYTLIVARIIGGVGVGLASIVSPLYISEISPRHLRGRLVSLFQLTICLGILVAMFVNAGLAGLSDRLMNTDAEGWMHAMFAKEAWRGMFAMEALPALAFLLLCFAIPRSPRWLAAKGRKDEALSTLKKVRATDEEAEQELAEIGETVSHESASISQLLHPGLRKALFIGIFLAVFSELSGITIVMYYGPSILENAGFSMGASLGGHATIGIVLTLFTLLAVWLVDKVGRRPLMAVGNAGAFLGLAGIGIMFHLGVTEGLVLVGMMCLFVASFAFSLGPIKWIVMSEIFPTKIRGRAVGIATLALWLTDVCLSQFFPMIRDSMGVATSFFLFACFLIPQFFFIWKVMPETKGKSLEEIEKEWTHAD